MAHQLSTEDKDLIQAARHIISLRFKADWHSIGRSLRTHSGKVFSSVHLEAHIGRVAICAEAVALGMAAASGDTEIDTVVAVNHMGEVVAPCGMCRELISDYSPAAKVIVPAKNGEEVISVSKLLPNKYVNKA